MTENTDNTRYMQNIGKCARMIYVIAIFSYILTDFLTGLVFLMLVACSAVILDGLNKLQGLKNGARIYIILMFGALLLKYAYSKSIIL